MTPQVPQGQAHTRLQAASQAVKARSQAVKARLVAMDVSDTLHIDAVAQAQIAMVDIVLLEGMEAHVKHALNEAHAEVERVTMDLTERTVERDAAQEWRLYNADAAERIMERAKAAESERDEARAALAAAERTLAEIEKRSTRADDGLACHPLNEREHRMSDDQSGAEMIAAERQRQIDVEGYAPARGVVVTAVPLDGDRLREMEADALSPFASIRTRGVSALVAALRASWAEVERLTGELAVVNRWNDENVSTADFLDEHMERHASRADRAESERDEARAALAAAEREINRLATFLSDEASTLRAHHVGRDAIENPVDAAHLADVIDETLAASRTGAADKENDR